MENRPGQMRRNIAAIIADALNIGVRVDLPSVSSGGKPPPSTHPRKYRPSKAKRKVRRKMQRESRRRNRR